MPAKDLGIVSQKRLEVARALATGRAVNARRSHAGLNPSEIDEAMNMIRRVQARASPL